MMTTSGYDMTLIDTNNDPVDTINLRGTTGTGTMEQGVP